MPARPSPALAALLLLLSGCTGAGAPASATPSTAAPSRQAAGVLRHDTPYAQVAAEARRRGAPILLYFWTDW